MTSEEREHIRRARSEIQKSLRKRDTRMFQDVQKSVNRHQLDQEQTLVDPDLLGDSANLMSVLE